MMITIITTDQSTVLKTNTAAVAVGVSEVVGVGFAAHMVIRQPQ